MMTMFICCIFQFQFLSFLFSQRSRATDKVGQNFQTYAVQFLDLILKDADQRMFSRLRISSPQIDHRQCFPASGDEPVTECHRDISVGGRNRMTGHPVIESHTSETRNIASQLISDYPQLLQCDKLDPQSHRLNKNSRKTTHEATTTPPCWRYTSIKQSIEISLLSASYKTQTEALNYKMTLKLGMNIII